MNRHIGMKISIVCIACLSFGMEKESRGEIVEKEVERKAAGKDSSNSSRNFKKTYKKYTLNLWPSNEWTKEKKGRRNKLTYHDVNKLEQVFTQRHYP